MKLRTVYVTVVDRLRERDNHWFTYKNYTTLSEVGGRKKSRDVRGVRDRQALLLPIHTTVIELARANERLKSF